MEFNVVRNTQPQNMMKKFLFILFVLMAIATADAQRKTDVLGRGLVAVPVGSAGNSKWNFVSWRRLANEYYDVTYNLYKDGVLLASNLTNTSYYDGSKAYTTTSYQVAAVIKGSEQSKCTAVTPWKQYIYTNAYRTGNGYIDLTMSDVYDRNGNIIDANHYSPNDAEFADLDGDNELEMIIRRNNDYDAANSWDGTSKDIYATSSVEFDIFDAYDIDWQTGATTLMWRIDCGPNMASLNHTECNLIAFDWDEDGKAEVVMRGADNMRIWNASLTSYTTIGSATTNTRDKMTSHSNSQYAWTHTGNEYLIYLNGQTGALYSSVTYPLPRLESGESSENSAWGDSYGHRSTKHFFGAPSFDGRTHSLFLARGIYTRHKMIAMDLNKSSHTWSTRWTWSNNTSGSIWYGQGNHNYVVADVDEDGRDEIVYGSMCIDDNGMGLSSTGLGHGDAIHVSDMNPYRPGLEAFACNEDKPSNNYRDATTSEILYRLVGSDDDGRALMANLSNTYPGSMGRSTQSGMISSVTNSLMNLASDGDSYINYGDLNFRIYWDGDLCSEILNSPGTGKEAKIEKPEVGRLFTSSGCNMNNDSKNNACFQGDLIGDWREEIAVRCGTNVRIYTTGISTSYNMPCLWYDHQYRQAMVWQMMAYNQPPHLSYFIGEMEGFTVAPPPYTMQDRTEIANGGTIGTTHKNKQVIMAETNDMTVSVASGASPWVFIDNAPTWTQGNNGSAINTTTYTHTLTGSGFTGAMNLTKQGKGTLVLPNVTETYTGKTEIWAGTLQFDGTMSASPVWLNRHAKLASNGGKFNKSVESLYGSEIIPGGENNKGSMTIASLTLNYGARLIMDIYGDDKTADNINIGTLNIGTKTGDVWENYGPEYLAPVIEFVRHGSLTSGKYLLGTITTLNGTLDDIVVEGLPGNSTYELALENGKLYLNLEVEAGQDPASDVDGFDITNAMAPFLSTASVGAWTNNGFSVNTGFGWEDTNGDASTTWPFIEKYIGEGTLADCYLTQTINELPNGTYYIGGSFIATNQFDSSVEVTGVTFTAQDRSIDVATADHVPERYSLKVNVTDGTLTYGINVSGTNANWVAMDNLFLIYDGTEDEYYDNATEDAPVRVVLTNPRMEDNNDGWTLNSAGNGVWQQMTATYANFDGPFMESWTADTGSLGNKSAMQTVSLKEGNYLLKAAVNATRQNDASISVSGVTLNFGDESVDCHTANGIPEVYNISTTLDEGNYDIGLRIQGTEANWVAWDNIILYYYGQGPGPYHTALARCQEAAAANETKTAGAAKAALADFEWTEAEYATKTTEEIAMATKVLNNGADISNASQVATSVIKNVDFTGATQGSGRVVYPGEWNYTYRTSGYNDTWVDATNKLFNAWAATISRAELSQKLSSIPNGTYKLTADVRVDKTASESRTAIYGVGENTGRSEEAGSDISGSTTGFANYATYFEVTDNTATIGIRSDYSFYQIKNVALEFVTTNMLKTVQTDNSYLRQNYYWNGRDSYEYDATGYEYRYASGVVVYPQQPNQIVKARSTSQFANKVNKVVNGTCANFVVADGSGLQITSATGTFTATQATYSRTMDSGYKWGTVIMPFELNSDENIQFYEPIETRLIKGTNYLCFRAVESVAANTPAVYQKLSDDATNVTMAASVKAVELTSNAQPAVFDDLSFTGVYINQIFIDNIDGYYYIAHDKFWSAANLEGNLNVPAFRTYLTMDGGAKLLNIMVIDDDATNIMAIDPSDGKLIKSPTDIYNLSGQLVKSKTTTLNGLAPGIYIVNGKKVNVKK